MVKDDDQEKQGKTVPYSKRGEYTVTLQQNDFIQEGEDEATGAQAPDDKDQAVEPAEPTAEKKDLTVADVKLEDVKVYYQVLVNRTEVEADESGDAEPQYETREAQTKALSNYDGALTLSFADSDAASNATDTYYVVIDALMSYAPVNVDIPQQMLTTESSVASDSESADVTIKAQDATFAPGISASDITLGGSFEGMGVVGAEAAGDALTVHLSGMPKMDYEVASTYTAGQVTIAGSGFENTPRSATAYVPIDLPEEAFDLGGEEALALATATGDVDYSTVDGGAGKATVLLQADLGSFNDVKPESITLKGSFAGGKVESVSKEGEDGNVLKVQVSFPANGVSESDYNLAGTLKLAAAR